MKGDPVEREQMRWRIFISHSKTCDCDVTAQQRAALVQCLPGQASQWHQD